MGLNNWKSGVDTKMRNSLQGAGLRAVRNRKFMVCFEHGEDEMPNRHQVEDIRKQ